MGSIAASDGNNSQSFTAIKCNTNKEYAHFCGPFDYNKMPLAPIRCEVQVQENDKHMHVGISQR
jgi:hypothetical protein